MAEIETGKMHKTRSTEAFYGRRKGKLLRPHQRDALETKLNQLKIDITQPSIDSATELCSRLWPFTPQTTRLEIGFGGGEHLLHRATQLPNVGFVGVEPFVNSMAKLSQNLTNKPLNNIRLYDDDATQLLDWLPSNCFDHIDLLYPDPWHKKRHWKRRFVSKINLDRFAKILKPGGTFCFASDIDTYVNWTLQHIKAHPEFYWTAEQPSDWEKPWDGWPSTRYEAKAFREGRTPAYLTFKRV